jgi:hypothetical protein
MDRRGPWLGVSRLARCRRTRNCWFWCWSAACSFTLCSCSVDVRVVLGKLSGMLPNSNVGAVHMSCATTVLLAMLVLPISALAQTSADEQLSAYRACARAHAPEAQAAGARTHDEAVAYFGKVCLPTLGLSLGSNDVSKDKPEPLRPAILRVVFREEWIAFIEGAAKR